MTIDTLRTIDCFTGLEEGELKKIDAITEYIELKEGEILFTEGENSRDLYFVIEGRFNVMIRMLANSNYEDNSILTTVKGGEMLGEIGFVDGAPRSATVKVRNDAKLLKVSYERRMDIFREDPVIGYKFMTKIAAIMANRVRTVNIMWRNAMVL